MDPTGAAPNNKWTLVLAKPAVPGAHDRIKLHVVCVDGTAPPNMFGTSPEGVLRYKAKVRLGTQTGKLLELFTSAHDAALSAAGGLGIGLTLNGAAIATLFPAGARQQH